MGSASLAQLRPVNPDMLDRELTIAEMLLSEAAYCHAEGLGCILARRIASTRAQRLDQGHAASR
jgi:hypothetical protein